MASKNLTKKQKSIVSYFQQGKVTRRNAIIVGIIKRKEISRKQKSLTQDYGMKVPPSVIEFARECRWGCYTRQDEDYYSEDRCDCKKCKKNKCCLWDRDECLVCGKLGEPGQIFEEFPLLKGVHLCEDCMENAWIANGYALCWDCHTYKPMSFMHTETLCNSCKKTRHQLI